MRYSKVVLLAAVFGLAACSKNQRKYDPQRRSGNTAAGQAAPSSSEQTPPAAPNGDQPTPNAGVPAGAAQEHAPEITDRKWCHLREAGFNFVVDRYVFSGGDHPATTVEELIFAPNQDPQVRPAPATPEWTAVSSARVGQGSVQLGVEALDTATAQATPAFHDQAILFNKMIDTASLEVSLDSLGDDGAVRVTRPGQPDLVLFDCQNYSDDFVSLDIGGPDAHKPSAQGQAAPSREASAEAAPAIPAAPAPADRGTVRALLGDLTPVPVKNVNFSGTRWCSYKPVRDDVIVGLLAIEKGKFTLNHLRASMLKGKSIDKSGLRKAAIGRVVRGEITLGTDSKFTTTAGPAFRLVQDRRDQRALILDNLGGADRPSSTAEIFFTCDADQSPIEDARVTSNLVTAAALAKSLR